MQVSIQDGNRSEFIPRDVKNINELANIITKHTYSLGVFDKGHRSNASFLKANFIGLDFDGGMTLDEALNEFRGRACIIGTTKSHQAFKAGAPPCDRFRVILPLAEDIVTPEDLKATALSLLNKYPNADKACSDAARMFFVSKNIEYINDLGPKTPVVKYVKPTLQLASVTTPIIKGALAKSTLEFISFGASRGEWNVSLFKAALDCMEQGYSQNETVDMLRKSTAGYDGDFDATDLSTIASAFNREPKYPPRGIQNCFDFKRPNDIVKEGQKVNWLVEGLMIAGGTSILAGVPKSGKSTIARQLGVGVAKGNHFFNRGVSKGKVLYLAMEESAELLSEQFKRIGLTDTDDMLIHVGPVMGGNMLDNLKETIIATNAKLLVVDTLLLLARFNDINSYKETYEKMSEFSMIARSTGCHILFLHHQKKGEDRGQDSISGSSALQGSVDMFMVLNTVKGRDQYRKLTSWQRGGTRFNNTELKYNADNDTYDLSASQEFDF